MHIQDFADRVLIIDNKEDEIADLVKELENLDIEVTTVIPPADNEMPTLKKNRQLVFVDLMLDENEALAKSNISRLVTLLSSAITPSFGPYGLIVWTKHPESVDILKQVISEAIKPVGDIGVQVEDDAFGTELSHLQVAPMFIVPLNKTKYIEKGNYSGVLQDLETELSKSNAGYFFMRWSTSVKEASNKTISDIYGLCKDYSTFEECITYLLYKLAINHTGSSKGNLVVDSYKAFDELLYADLYVKQFNIAIPTFGENPQNPWGDSTKDNFRLASELNRKMFLDNIALEQATIIPGNIYELKGDFKKLKIEEKPLFSYKKVEYPYESLDIAIELTPPCDNANTDKKIASRLVSGYIVTVPDDFDDAKTKKFAAHFSTCEKQYVLHNVQIDGKPKHVVFDYRHLYTPSDADLVDPTKFKLIYRAKPKLFADILQKFSSHASRLGLSSIEF